jgi:hypothetical protein
MTNILFLDMDGVLCTARSTFMAKEIYGEVPHNYLDKEATEYILRIVRKYGFKIVVSSVWRGHPEFKAAMRYFGFVFSDFHPDWRTKNIDIGSRGLEIQDWLDRNEPQLDKYIIFEDEPSDLLTHHKEQHLVQCDTYNGIMFNSIMQFDKRVIDLGIKPISK